ncbi:WecB/TagA/CpsF family glycosyltransferase [Roseobacter sinensis]|uniref:WecB/TagA/CpsF family glycosyltransferase n=1 Tax=Roseobacter sinensis TaxID=2931391 RepID=A0ABT3BJP7_9RHOB|nr:WecB/TagA/CpsF family glycosyltransferase [Roseobacter sp. WL0113]MCV3273799.1 WecB/TagA/CpsF family glycosyltransferase [Roseobacter sp. WL0113]
MIDWSNLHDSGRDMSADGVYVNALSRSGLLQDVERRFEQQRGFCIATLNLDHVVKLQQDPAFRAAYKRHSHVTADGNPIIWLSWLAGTQMELLPGSDLIAPVVALAAAQNVPLALLGATQSSLDRAAEALKAAHPGLRVVASVSPAMGFDPTGAEADRCIAQLRESGARLCLLALGAPKQEIFAARAADQLPETGFMSIGAGLDFISGDQVRAPKWVRRIAAEWLWRLLQNPRRLTARYGACLALLPRLVRMALQNRRHTMKRSGI